MLRHTSVVSAFWLPASLLFALSHVGISQSVSADLNGVDLLDGALLYSLRMWRLA